MAGSATNVLTLTSASPGIEVSTGTATFSTGRIEGASGFTKTGAGSLIIQSASGVSGAVNVSAGTLSLGTSAGTLATVTSVSVARGATFQLNNDTVGNKNDNRLGDIDVTLNGGNFNFVGIRATSGSNSNEFIDRLVLGTGASTLSLANSGGSSVVGLLTLDNATAGISRAAGSTLAFVNDADAVVAVSAFAETNNIVGGWFTFDNTNFAALSGTNTGSIVAATVNETSFGTSNWSATENVVVASGGGLFQVGTNRALNSLVLSESTARVNLINSGVSLTVGSGGLIMTGANHAINGPGSITAGSGGNYTLFVHTTGGTSRTETIGAIIENNGTNDVSLVKAGPQTLLLTGANSFTGTTYINEGTLSINTGTSGTNAISGNVNIDGGLLSYGSTNNQIADASMVTMTAGGFDLGTRAETIESLTMTGGTLFRGGATLTLGNASSIAGGTLNFTSAASSSISTSSTLALGGANFSYASASTAGTGTLTLGGNVSYAASNTAGTTFSNSAAGVGRLELGSGTRTFDVADSTTLPSTTPEVSVNWTVTGSADLTKSGTGALLLLQSNTYTGKTVIDGGFIAGSGESRFGANPGSFVADQITLNGGGILSTGSMDFNSNRGFTLGASGGTFDTSGGTITLTNVVTGGGGLSKIGSGTLSLAGSHTYTGDTNVTAGTLSLAAADRISNSSNLVVNGGNFDLNGFAETVGTVTISSGNINGSSNVLTGSSYALQGGTVNAILGTGAITVTSGTTTLGSAGRLNSGSSLAVNSGQLALGGAESVNSFTLAGGTLGGSSILTAPAYALNGGNLNAILGSGAVTVSTGTTTLGSAGRLDSGSSLTVNSGQLTLGGAESVSSLTLGGGTLAGPFALISAAAYDLQAGAVSASLGGAVGATKAGAGTVTLSGGNTFSGETTIGGGQLTASGTDSLGGTSGITITGGTLLLGGSGSRINNTATLALSGGTLNLGNTAEGSLGVAGIGDLTSSGTSSIDFGTGTSSIAFSGITSITDTLNIWNWSSAAADKFFVTLGTAGDVFNNVNFYNGGDVGSGLVSGLTGGQLIGSGANLELVPVPEVGALFGALGLLAPLAWRERRHWMRCREARV